MHVYLRNNPAKFHPNPTWNDTALDFLRVRPNNMNNTNKMTSVPDFTIKAEEAEASKADT